MTIITGLSIGPSITGRRHRAGRGRISAQATGQPKVEILPESEVDYVPAVTDAQVTFVKDGAGRVSQLVLHQGGSTLQTKKIQKQLSCVTGHPRTTRGQE